MKKKAYDAGVRILTGAGYPRNRAVSKKTRTKMRKVAQENAELKARQDAIRARRQEQ